MDRSALCRVLLDLCGTGRTAGLPALSSSHWSAIDALAAEHRLRPLLHAAHRDTTGIPGQIRLGWKEAYRQSAMLALIQRAERDATVRLLRAGGIEPLVLKGGWLAWHAYPEAALRPLRDIDLLLPEGRFGAGWDLLLEAGYRPSEPSDLPLSQLLEVDKSPPPLIAPRGTAIELHRHAWFPEGRLEFRSPAPDDAGLFARARTGDDGLLYPGAEDMLAHLVIHAVYSHRFDCGPLLLSDIDFLLRREPIDWPRFWDRGVAAGWADGARLVLELVRLYRPNQRIDLASAPVPPPEPELVEAARDLMLQDLSTRYSAGFAASGLAGGLKRLWPRITRRVAVAEGPEHRRSSERDGGYLRWAAERLKRTATDLASSDVRRQSRQLALLSRWLDR